MSSDKYSVLENELQELPFISPAQTERWVNLQKTIDGSRDYLIRAVPDARINIDTAQKILEQRTYTLVFFGGTGVGKSTLINSLLGRNLLPSGAVTAVTGTILYLEQADEGAEETLTFTYWTKSEFADRVRTLCRLARVEPFDVTNEGERLLAHKAISNALAAGSDRAKTEQDEYLEIILDCIATYDNHKELFKADSPPPVSYSLHDEKAFTHLREDGFKGSDQRQIRIIKSATFRVQPKDGVPNLLMNGFLRIVDVPGLGAGMRLHEAITLEEMKKEDAMIVLVSDAGRQRVDEMKSLQAVHWVKDNRLRGLTGVDLDEAAAKIFYVVNGGNVRQAYDRLNSGLPEAEREVKEVTRHIAPNYWEAYKDRGNGRPYFLIQPPAALYLQDPEGAPKEFASETRRIVEAFNDQLDAISGQDISEEADPFDADVMSALMELSEIPALREALIEFIRNDRIRSQLREAETRVRTALSSLKTYYEEQLADRNVYPPFSVSWESLQEKRFENLLRRLQKDLPRAFHGALVELSQRTNNEASFRRLVRPTLNQIQARVQDTIAEEVENLLEQYGTEHWDNRDVTYDNLIWGTSGIELPIKRILYQVELTMQEAVSQSMPRLGDVMSNELKRTLASHEIKSRLERASYDQNYTYTLPHNPGGLYGATDGLDALVERVTNSFRQTCRQAVMYELMSQSRSVNQRIESLDANFASNDALLEAALNGSVPQQQATPQPQAAPEPAVEDALEIRILDDAPAVSFDEDIAIRFDDEPQVTQLETSYVDRLETVNDKAKRVFANIVTDLFSDDDLLPRLRRLFWLEATRAERDFNNHIVKPLLRQHDRRLHSEELRSAMESDLESISDMEALMRTWEGLDKLEGKLGF